MSDNLTQIKCLLVGDSGVGKTSLVVSYTSDDYPTKHHPTALDKYAVDICVDNRRLNVQIFDSGGSEGVHSLRKLSYPNVHTIILCFSVVQPESLWALRKRWLSELSENVHLNPAASLTVSKSGINNPQLLSTNRAGSENSHLLKLLPSSDHSETSPTHQETNFQQAFSRRSLKLSRSNRKNRSRSLCIQRPGPAFILVGCACDLRNDIKLLIDLSNRNEKPVEEEIACRLAGELGAEAYVECSALTQRNLKKVFDLAIWHGLRVHDAGGPIPIQDETNKSASNSISDQTSSSIITGQKFDARHLSPVKKKSFISNHKSQQRPHSLESHVGSRITPNGNPLVLTDTNYPHRSMWRKIFCFP